MRNGKRQLTEQSEARRISLAALCVARSARTKSLNVHLMDATSLTQVLQCAHCLNNMAFALSHLLRNQIERHKISHMPEQR
jgi:hypothetical protein